MCRYVRGVRTIAKKKRENKHIVQDVERVQNEACTFEPQCEQT